MIPVVYDIEEDSENYYIIQEYIEGISLRELFYDRTTINIENITDYFIQLTELFVYLHEQKPYPIIYIDLKPEHIICGQGRIHLIDFGSAIQLKNSYITGQFMGTKGFAAPEIVNCLEVDERTDIYVIGAVMKWWFTGKTLSENDLKKGIHNIEFDNEVKNCPGNLRDIIMKCLETEKDNRFQTVRELNQKLRQCSFKLSKDKSSYRIAVAGSQPRVGVTHFCTTLVCYLNQNHQKCLYEEKNDTAILPMLCEKGKGFYEQQGIVKGKHFYGLPKYGKGIDMGILDYDIVVQDYGYIGRCSTSEFEKADMCVIIGGIKEWEINYTKSVLNSRMAEVIGDKLYLVLQGKASLVKRYRNEFNLKKIYFMLFNNNPFIAEKNMKKFLEKLLKEV